MADDQDRATVSVFVDDAFNFGDPSLTSTSTPLSAAIDLFRATAKQDGRVAAEREAAYEWDLSDDEVTVVGALADMVDRMVGDA